ncbi:uncharacterized protein KY384_004567 [Bacidia gigantensis]|uniref:uncharacterized protein n=1 Tax=Bacidia gigantensis TaxID=2732470 RepID=UPI001D04EECE|nr:uncharacterized protein KY384_004567 [Bacidia gigantensis]KAG8531209.1 hypothetical protein KY384_004567 [Bacidia gigantensis]
MLSSGSSLIYAYSPDKTIMRSAVLAFTTCIAVSSASVLPRNTTQPFQHVPSDAGDHDGNYYIRPEIPENSAYFIHEQTHDPIPAEYQTRPIDVPLGLLNKGALNFFTTGFNVPDSPGVSPAWHTNDFANNTACGIPDSAHYHRRAAIHPYWLKYAPEQLGLDRFCMSDICINIWNETGFKDGTTDIMVKVMDVCSTDPNDSNYCASPADIMIDRDGARILYAGTPSRDQNAIDSGKQYPRPGQTAYDRVGLPNYVRGNLLTTDPLREAARFDEVAKEDWKKDLAKGNEVQWCPVAGGSAKHGKPPNPEACGTVAPVRAS